MYRLLLLLTIISVSTISQADEKGIYLGFNVGNTTFNDDGLYRNYEAIDDDDKWSILGGYTFFHWLAVEGQYSDLGRYGVKNFNNRQWNDDYSSLTGAAKFTLALNKYFEIYAKTGAGFILLDQEYTTDSGTKLGNESLGATVYIAAGVAVNVTKNIAITALYDTHIFAINAQTQNTNEIEYLQSISALNLGLEFSF